MPCDLLKNLKPIVAKNDLLLDTEETAAAIREIRTFLKIPQKVLAIEMGISQAFLADLEAARRRWSFKRFKGAKEALERLSK